MTTTINLNGLWRSDIPVLPEDDAYHPVNAALSWRADGRWRWRWQLAGHNLGDEDGAVAARGMGALTRRFAPPSPAGGGG